MTSADPASTWALGTEPVTVTAASGEEFTLTVGTLTSGDEAGSPVSVGASQIALARALQGFESPAVPALGALLQHLAAETSLDTDWAASEIVDFTYTLPWRGANISWTATKDQLIQAVDLTCLTLRLATAAGRTGAIGTPTLHEIEEAATSWLRVLFSGAPEHRQWISDRIVWRLGDDFPWHRVQPPATGLALLYNFSPFQDTGSTVASKRLREFAASVDVIACSFLHHKKQDPTIERISAPYVTSKYFLPLSPTWASWEPCSAFAVQASNLAERYLADGGGRHEFVYTRAMWAPPIYAGARLKLRHPELRWIVEFSDPLSLDVEGRHRGGPVQRDATSTPLLEAYEKAYGQLGEEDVSIFALAEHLAYAFADEIIFTNANQQRVMLDHLADEDLRRRVEAVARVSQHPTLPATFYEMYEAGPVLDPHCLNLAYFGEFYSSRGLTEVTSAIRTLPDHLRSLIRLHVFTNYVSDASGGVRQRSFSVKQHEALVQRAIDGVGAEGIEELVTFHPSLPYLQFLAATNGFDLLIVADAQSGDNHPVNPYLPSKWSDYSGSRAHTWALVERNSVLSTKDPTERSTVGSVREAREVLWRLAEQKVRVATKYDGGDGR